MPHRVYRAGILGFGNVVQSFLKHYISLKQKIIREYGFALKFNAVCDSCSFVYSENFNIRNLLEKKQKGHPVGKATNNPLIDFAQVIHDRKIDLLIDALPTNKYDAGPSLSLLLKALSKKIDLVMVNKSPLVFKGKEIIETAKKYNCKIGLSATTAGALPTSGIILNEILAGKIYQVRGILNGTSNYVLDRIIFGKKPMLEAVREAIEMGISEPDYRYDLTGIDTCFKMIIIALLITGESVLLKNIKCIGVMDKTEDEIIRESQNGRIVRLIGELYIKNGKPCISVQPEVLTDKDPLYYVRGTNKGITFRTKYMGDFTILGGGSSRTAVAATILKDIINFYKKRR